MGDNDSQDYAEDALNVARDGETPSSEQIKTAIDECIAAAEAAYQRKMDVREAEYVGQYSPKTVEEAGGPKNDDFSWYHGKFKVLYERNPENAVQMGEALQAVKPILSDAHLTQIDGNASLFDHWGGEMADDFKTYFLVPFPNALDNQRVLIDELRAAIACYEGVLRKARQDALTIAQKAKEVFDGIEGNDFSWDVALQILGIAASIAAAIPTGGASLGFAGYLSLVGTAVSIGQLAISLDTIEGADVFDVERTMLHALGDAYDVMRYEEQEIADAVTASIQVVRDTLAGIPQRQSPGTPGRNDPLTRSTLLPHEPKGDGTPNLTNGATPQPGPNGLYPVGYPGT